MLLRKFTLLHDQFHGLSPWRHGFTAAWKSGGAAGATHVQISWISAWIPSEVTRTFFSIFPYRIQIQVHFHVGHFLAKGNQQLLVPLFGAWGTNFSEILISIHSFSFKKIHSKMLSAKWRQFCLTHCDRDKMAAFSQTTPLNAFSWIKMHWLLLTFHSSLFPRDWLIIFQHWFR